MTFAEIGLCKALLTALDEQDYLTPTPIQQQAIPVILAGRDVMAAAQTGTGKTAGFTLPLLQRLMLNPRPATAQSIRALVLTPTRELAAQVAESIQTYGKHLPLKHAVVFGGVGIQPQIERLRRGVDVLVATPGRLLDLYQQRAVQFNQLECLVLDEADRMLDMGFIHDIRKVLKLLPKERQTLLFSATFSEEIRTLAQGLLKQPVSIEVAVRNTTAATVTQSVFEIDKARKTALLSHLVRSNDWQQVLVFTRTKHGANRLADKLAQDGISSAAIHGNKSQNARTKALSDFKLGAVRVLVATDIAARGLDIEQLPHVVNFELPNVAEDYVHRIGRTGRAGASGVAVSLVEKEELILLKAIERLTRQTLVRETIPVLSTSQLTPIIKIAPPINKPKPKTTADRPNQRESTPSRRNAPKAQTMAARDARPQSGQQPTRSTATASNVINPTPAANKARSKPLTVTTRQPQSSRSQTERWVAP